MMYSAHATCSSHMCDRTQAFVKGLWKQLCPSCGIFWCSATSWTVGCQIAHALITPLFCCPHIGWTHWSRYCWTDTKNPHSITSWLSPPSSTCAYFLPNPLNIFFFVTESTLTILSHILAFHPSIFPSPTFSWPTSDPLFFFYPDWKLTPRGSTVSALHHVSSHTKGNLRHFTFSQSPLMCQV